MCDYSLYAFGNRLCQEGQYLVAQRFTSGCVGFISDDEAESSDSINMPEIYRLWMTLRTWLFPRRSYGPVAVCLPPGARLRLDPVEADIRGRFDLRDQAEAVVTQATADEFQYRDGLRFENGIEILLQGVSPGQRVRLFR
jgi:hypothetical protein